MAAMPLSGVAYHRCCVNFGQPWCIFEKQHGYPVRVPKARSVPSWSWSKLRRWRVTITWFGCWKYCLVIKSSDIWAGKALKAMRSKWSAKSMSPVISTIFSSEYINSTAEHNSEPCVGLFPCKASSPPYMPCGCPWNRRISRKPSLTASIYFRSVSCW